MPPSLKTSLPRWLHAQVPSAPRIALSRALAWGTGAFSISFVLGLMAWHGLGDALRLAPARTPSAADFVGTVLFAPAIETLLLVWAVGRSTRAQAWEVVVVAALIAAAHVPFRVHALLFVPIFGAFLVFAGYLRWRSASASAAICWAEGFLMHAWHNMLALALVVVS